MCVLWIMSLFFLFFFLTASSHCPAALSEPLLQLFLFFLFFFFVSLLSVTIHDFFSVKCLQQTAAPRSLTVSYHRGGRMTSSSIIPDRPHVNLAQPAKLLVTCQQPVAGERPAGRHAEGEGQDTIQGFLTQSDTGAFYR